MLYTEGEAFFFPEGDLWTTAQARFVGSALGLSQNGFPQTKNLLVALYFLYKETNTQEVSPQELPAHCQLHLIQQKSTQRCRTSNMSPLSQRGFRRVSHACHRVATVCFFRFPLPHGFPTCLPSVFHGFPAKLLACKVSFGFPVGFHAGFCRQSFLFGLLRGLHPPSPQDSSPLSCGLKRIQTRKADPYATPMGFLLHPFKKKPPNIQVLKPIIVGGWCRFQSGTEVPGLGTFFILFFLVAHDRGLSTCCASHEHKQL